MRLGIDFGGTNLKTGVFNEDGSMVDFKEVKLFDIGKGESLLEDFLNYIKTYSSQFQISKGGLAIKGLINKKTGVLEEDIGIASIFSGINLIEKFEEYLNVPFSIENDARSYAWGEWKFGAGIGSKKMVCMTLGTGLGCSLISGGKPYEGADSLGGLLGGHISIDRNGPTCTCGNIGCLELYCSATALQKIIFEKYKEFRNEKNSLKKFFERIRNREQKYIKTFDDFISNLSIGIANVIHAYGPDTVVLGGGVLNSADVILPKVIELVYNRAWTVPRGKVKIKKSKLGNKAAVLGAAFL